jgi:type IX secretion system PorP/SprF family membrane protein
MKLLMIVLICLSANLWAQDIHFSQLGVNNLVNNPAAAGFYRGWERLSINHKNQWVNANTSFLTTAIAADVNLFKPRGDKGAYLGVGIIFYNDIGGDSQFGLRHFSASISGIVPLNRNNRVSFGFSPGFGQKSANLDGVLFPNQFDGQFLNASISSSELSTISSRMYGDFSLGLLYQYGATRQSIAASHQMALTLGVGYHHFNSPQLNFNGLYTESIYSKMSVGGELVKDFTGSKMGIETVINYYKQGPHKEFFLSTMARYQLISGSKITRLRKTVVLSYGLGYRHKDAIIPMLKYQKGDWQFGLSYDITVSSLGSFARGGGLEFSLIYNSQRFALFKRR